MNLRRRLLIGLGVGALAGPITALAQQPARIPRIGILYSESAAAFARQLEVLRAGLRDLGYVEGKNLVIEFRWAEGKYERLPGLAAELVRLKVDIIVTHASPGTLAAKQATTSIPIVIAASTDAVAAGLVTSLARPGGNVTGLTSFGSELAAKRLEMLKDAFPRLQRVSVLWGRAGAMALYRQVAERAAKSLKLELQHVEVSGPDEFEIAFAAMAKGRVDAVVMSDDPMLHANEKRFADLAAKQRLPTAGRMELAEAGGLIGYAPSRLDSWRRAAVFVDKILKGAKPGELPVERPTKFELVVNLKAAKAMGVTFPPSFLVRADRVIE